MPRQTTDDALWVAAIDDFRSSGLTQPELSRRRGLPLHTFRRRLYARSGDRLPGGRARSRRLGLARYAAISTRHSRRRAERHHSYLGFGRLARPHPRRPHPHRRLIRLRSRDPPSPARPPRGLAVIGLPPTLRVFVATAPVDLRKSYDGLTQIARDALDQDPLSGHLLVFANRRRDRVKILYWDKDGFALWTKRREVGTFRWPDPTAVGPEWTPAELAAMLGGIDLNSTRRRPRYIPAAP